MAERQIILAVFGGAWLLVLWGTFFVISIARTMKKKRAARAPAPAQLRLVRIVELSERTIIDQRSTPLRSTTEELAIGKQGMIRGVQRQRHAGS